MAQWIDAQILNETLNKVPDKNFEDFQPILMFFTSFSADRLLLFVNKNRKKVCAKR